MPVINVLDEDTVKHETVRQRPPRFSAPHLTLDHDDEVPALANTTKPLMPGQQLYDRFYQLIDAKSKGRAVEVLRLIKFLLVGGSASVLNLICVAILDKMVHPQSGLAVFLVLMVATEISLLFNFALNDRFTFRALISDQRTWVQRCVRFHGPASVGFALTLIIANSVHHFAPHLPLVVPQAIAIVIVTVVNFLMHRNWTYREFKGGSASATTWAE
jgi:putative flippase GtrA